jgi:hypothetical protein
VKLKDIEKGSPAAYREAVKLVREQIEFELETCEILFGTDPEKVLELLATESADESAPNCPPSTFPNGSCGAFSFGPESGQASMQLSRPLLHAKRIRTKSGDRPRATRKLV